MYPFRRLLRRVLPKPVALALRAAWLTRQTVSGRGHVETDVELLPRVIRSTDTCWDIGANIGQYTVALSPLAASVVAFEPVPHNFGILEDVVRRLDVRNVKVYRLAVSDADGQARMSVPVDGFYGGYYLAALDKSGEIAVETVTVDRMVADGLPRPDFIKVDVEGAEMQVIRGARALLATAPPVWLIETFEDELIPAMTALGYTTYSRTGPGHLEPVTARSADQRNYWFFPPGRTP